MRGSDAQKLIARLRRGEDEQSALAEFMPLSEEMVFEGDEDEGAEDTYDAEIRSTHGSYNFPWRLDGQHGFATAEFSGKGADLKIRIASVRDSEGHVIQPEAGMIPKLQDAARAYIGKE